MGVGGTRVGVGGRGVAVGRTRVGVGGTRVAVRGTDVAVAVAGVEVGAGGSAAATHSQTESKKFTVSRSLACGAAGEKPSNALRAALWRHMASTAPAGVTACNTIWLVVPSGNVSEMLLHPG